MLCGVTCLAGNEKTNTKHMTKAQILNAERKARKASSRLLKQAQTKAKGWADDIAEALAQAFQADAYKADAAKLNGEGVA
jgi:hypothetical protein